MSEKPTSETATQFGPGFLPTFLYYFSSTALVFSLVITQGLNIGFDTGVPQQTGILAGLLAGLLGAYANRTTTLTLPYTHKNQKQQLIAQIETVLSDKGYQSHEQVEEISVYERPAIAKYLSGKIFVQVEAKQITLAGRVSQIRSLRKQLT